MGIQSQSQSQSSRNGSRSNHSFFPRPEPNLLHLFMLVHRSNIRKLPIELPADTFKHRHILAHQLRVKVAILVFEDDGVLARLFDSHFKAIEFSVVDIGFCYFFSYK